tara:strand:+ start:335 stop:868 length:534 start_codon:yes stop_codon:yes gene_type:complete
VIEELQTQSNIRLTLFLRPAKRGFKTNVDNVRIIEGDSQDHRALTRSIARHDIVFLNLTGHSGEASRNITTAMKETHVKRIIVICPIAVYETPLTPIVIPYKKIADTIRNSGLEYTIIQPTWLTCTGRLHYKVTGEVEFEKGMAISQIQLFPLINKIMEAHEKYMLKNLQASIPNSQ